MSEDEAKKAAIRAESEKFDTLTTLRARLMPLCLSLERMRDEWLRDHPESPPNWPQVQRSLALINSQITTLNNLINDPKDNYGYREKLASLLPHPVAPFPVEEKNHILEVIMRKKPEVSDEKWIYERLQKASEFCRLPPELDVAPKVQKPGDEDDHGDGEEEEDARYKRAQRNLGEDELTEIWNEVRPAAVLNAQDTLPFWYPREGDSEEDESDEGDDVDMEDVDVDDANNANRKGTQPAPAPLPMESILRFMSTGTASLA